jgi:hypothetical protein
MVCASEKYASEIEIFTFGRGFPGADFTQQRAKKAFSLVNDQAVLDDRIFQQNRPFSACRHQPQIGICPARQIANLHSKPPSLYGAERVEKRGFRVPKRSLQMNDQPELSLR